MPKLDLMGWSLMLASGLTGGVGNLMIKRASVGPFSGAVSPWFLGSIVFFLAQIFLLTRAMEDLPLSLAAPVVTGVNFLVVALGAALVFGESLSLWQYLGLSAIVLGIFLVGRS